MSRRTKCLAESIGLTVLRTVRELKKDGKVWPWHVPIELYLADKEFDIKLLVSLLPKKSKYEVGMEMFHGDKGRRDEEKR